MILFALLFPSASWTIYCPFLGRINYTNIGKYILTNIMKNYLKSMEKFHELDGIIPYTTAPPFSEIYNDIFLITLYLNYLIKFLYF